MLKYVILLKLVLGPFNGTYVELSVTVVMAVSEIVTGIDQFFHPPQYYLTDI